MGKESQGKKKIDVGWTNGSHSQKFNGFKVDNDEIGIATGGGGGHMMSVQEHGKTWGFGFGDLTAEDKVFHLPKDEEINCRFKYWFDLIDEVIWSFSLFQSFLF